MRASLFSLLLAAFSSVTVLAQPPRSMTTLDLKQLSVEFDDQSRELSYVVFELSPPDGGFVMHCSNSRSFQVLPLPVSPLKVECRSDGRFMSEVSVFFSLAEPLPRMRPDPSSRPELDDGFPVQLGISFAERGHAANGEHHHGPGNEIVQKSVEIPTSRLSFKDRSFGRYQFARTGEDIVLAQLSTPID